MKSFFAFFESIIKTKAQLKNSSKIDNRTEEQKKEDLRKTKEEARQYLKEQGYKGNIKVISVDTNKPTNYFTSGNHRNHQQTKNTKHTSHSDSYDQVQRINDYIVAEDNDNHSRYND
ncbi:hypothetical protein MZM54_02160 [[Brevibacterium] frigoritolerans]|nr:hypothetical protein [Peribacillus frigoritolerans]